MTIHARAALFSHMRGFVERDLAGVFSWNDMTPGVDLPSDRIEYGRRNPLGNWKEIASVSFGRGYDLRVSSPQEKPPLGLIELELDDKLIDSGPIDQRTWDRLAAFIKDREKSYV